jgi:hypothetical protein
MCDVVRNVQFPALKELELWRLRPEIRSVSDSHPVLREALDMRDVVAQQGHQGSLTRLWLMSCSEDLDTLPEFREWPKECEFVSREAF